MLIEGLLFGRSFLKTRRNDAVFAAHTMLIKAVLFALLDCFPNFLPNFQLLHQKITPFRPMKGTKTSKMSQKTWEIFSKTWEIFQKTWEIFPETSEINKKSSRETIISCENLLLSSFCSCAYSPTKRRRSAEPC